MFNRTFLIEAFNGCLSPPGSGSPTIGFFADEIHAAVPEAVRAGGAGSAAGPQVDHSKLVPLLWAAVQELSEQVAELKAELKLKA